MEDTRYLIMAGGKEERWRKHLGTHKHLIYVDGERLIDRTVRLLRERGATEIVIVAKHASYDLAGAQRVPPKDLDNGGVVASADFWSPAGRTTVLFGDVFFTDEAMDSICRMSAPVCTFVGRCRRSRITGCPYGELFGLSLLPENHETVLASIARVKQAVADGEIKACAGWSVYRHLLGLPLRKHRCPRDFLEINDFTEDFDVPEDYDRWFQRYQTRHEARSWRWVPWRRAA